MIRNYGGFIRIHQVGSCADRRWNEKMNANITINKEWLEKNQKDFIANYDNQTYTKPKNKRTRPKIRASKKSNLLGETKRGRTN